MPNKEKVFEAFGELLYAVVRAEGRVKKDTAKQLEKLFQNYSWANEAIWSFKYEKNRKNSFEEAYENALDTFIAEGPMEEYQSFFELLDEIGQENHPLLGIRGKKVLMNFKRKLHRTFMEDKSIFSDDDFDEENPSSS